MSAHADSGAANLGRLDTRVDIRQCRRLDDVTYIAVFRGRNSAYR